MKKSQAKKIRNMIQLQKGLLKQKQKLADFKEPVIWLMRRNGDIEFYDNATKGRFFFNHSDGDERNIELIQSQTRNFTYAGRRVRVHVLHEDYPTPIPEDPVITTEILSISQQKIMQDLNKFRAQEMKIRSGATFKLLIGIAIVVAAIALGLTVIPSSFWDKIFKAKEQAPALGSLYMFLKIKRGTKCQNTKT